jgi:hypothetical protein
MAATSAGSIGRSSSADQNGASSLGRRLWMVTASRWGTADLVPGRLSNALDPTYPDSLAHMGFTGPVEDGEVIGRSLTHDPTTRDRRAFMHLMQYEITLPADYDMAIIRQRVASRGSRTDAFPGLGIKAYLVRELGRHGSPVNQYAPFYLWAELSGMDEFLFGPGFNGIRTDFGRPSVRTWRGIAVSDGPERAAAPAFATRTIESIDPGQSLTELAGSLVAETAGSAQEAGVNCTATGIDPSTWQLVRLTLWSGRVPDDVPGERYTVLHVSQPHRGDLLRVSTVVRPGDGGS